MESKLSMEVCEIKTGSAGIKHFFPQLWLRIRKLQELWMSCLHPWPIKWESLGVGSKHLPFFFLISSSDTSMPLSVKGTQTEYRAIKT